MQLVTNNLNNTNKKLVLTMTGEVLQPVRVYYNVKDNKAIKK